MTIHDDSLPQDWKITESEVNLQEIQAAKIRIQKYVPVTPVTKSLFNSDRLGAGVFFKLENFNITGSFKIRGAGNALLSDQSRDSKSRVIAASAGNHAQGVAYMARLLGRKATIFMPERTPMVKVVATK
jgi:threonine dehydratase